MKKLIKNTVAIGLTAGAFTMLAPTTEGFSLITPVSARTSVLSAEELRSLSIKISNGDNLKICSENYDGKEVDISDIDPESEKEFYAVLPTGSNKINVSTDVKGSHYIAKIFTSKNEDAKAYDPEDDIYLEDDVTNLYIRTYRSKDDYDEVKDTDVTDCANTYVVHIKKEEAFSKKYSSNSDTNTNTGYTQSKDIYKDNGGKLEQINTNPQVSNTQAKTNQWVKDGLGWQYNGADGATVRNNWILDNNTGKYYYAQVNGYITTGWKLIGSDWYYFDNSGAMQTGWTKVNNDWYYLDSLGKMAKNTNIEGYTLNDEGKMI